MKRLLPILLLLPMLSHADLKADLNAMSGSLAPALSGCQNIEAFYYGEKPAIKQSCSYHDIYGELQWAKKTIVIDGQGWYRLQYWIELL